MEKVIKINRAGDVKTIFKVYVDGSIKIELENKIKNKWEKHPIIRDITYSEGYEICRIIQRHIKNREDTEITKWEKIKNLLRA